MGGRFVAATVKASSSRLARDSAMPSVLVHQKSARSLLTVSLNSQKIRNLGFLPSLASAQMRIVLAWHCETHVLLGWGMHVFFEPVLEGAHVCYADIHHRCWDGR